MPTFHRDGLPLYYEFHGSGPALVFAHGRGGNAASWWQQVPAFMGRHRVIVFDHRGFARSIAPDAPHLQAYEDDLNALLDHLQIESAVLVGQSMGGRTCLPFAVRRPERVRGLVLVSTAGGLTIPEVLASQEARTSIPRGIEHRTAALSPSFPDREPALAFLYEALRAMTPPPGPLFRASLDGLDVGVSPQEVAGFGVPTLIVSGTEDPLYPPALLEAVQAALPGARLARLENVGHSPYWERADLFNGLLAAFLSELAD